MVINCPHTERPSYSLGMCQGCYLTNWHKRKYLKMQDNDVNESETKKQKIDVENDDKWKMNIMFTIQLYL